MKCPRCEYEQSDTNISCDQCRINFEKFLKVQGQSITLSGNGPKAEATDTTTADKTASLLFYVDPDISPFAFAGRVIIFLIVFFWGWKFISSSIESNYAGNSLLHLVNLPFHEAGHIFFRPFGRVIASLGGSLGQLLMPLICGFVILFQTRDTFGASITLWWFGENFMDIAPYINDARSLTMPLLGGNTGHTSPYGFHDWQFILTELNILRFNHTLATLAQTMGIILILLSYFWGGYILLKQLKYLRS